MEDNIFFYCAVIDRKFTLDQWQKFCQDKDVDKSVYIENEFIWNVHNVCINPHRIEINSDNGYVVVKTASAHGKWFVGADYSYRDNGGGSPCYYDIKKSYNSEKEAIIAGFKSLLKRKLSNYLLTSIKEKLFEQRQLSLF